ncbi:MAG: hypothetical protein ABIW02_01850 [Nitrosospira sp.]
MKPWSDFYDLIMPDLPGCPFVVVDNALRQSAISFCEQSLAWRWDHPDISIAAGTAAYAFTPPEGASVHSIIRAVLDGEEIASHAVETDLMIAGWRNRSGAPRYVLGGPTAVTLVPNPDKAGILTMTVALKPSPVSAGIEDSQFQEYREAIIHGGLARLMLSPKKPYTSTQLAAYHQQHFSIKTAAAGLRVARSYLRAPLLTTIMGRR